MPIPSTPTPDVTQIIPDKTNLSFERREDGDGQKLMYAIENSSPAEAKEIVKNHDALLNPPGVPKGGGFKSN